MHRSKRKEMGDPIRFFLGLYEIMLRRRALVLAAAILTIVTCSAQLTDVRLDMSMRPFNSNDEVEGAITASLEDKFGQRLGRYTGIIIESDSILTDRFLDELDTLTSRLERQPHISEVLSLTRYEVPDWTNRGALVEPLQKSTSGWSHAGLPDYAKPIRARADEILDEIHYPPTREQLSEVKYLQALARDSLRTPPASRTDSIRSDPRLKRILLSEDGTRTLVLARFDLSLRDPRRPDVMEAVKDEAVKVFGRFSKLRFVGYSHVENEFSRIVLLSLLQTFLLTFSVIALLLWIAYGRWALVLTALTGVGLTTPVTAGILTALGQDLTMINSMVPVVILIIGAADAIHMLQSFQNHLSQTSRRQAIRLMFGETGWPCLLTTLTTAGGFLGLAVADITAIRDFGLNVAIGVILVYAFNLIFVPISLAAFPVQRLIPSSRMLDYLGRWGEATGLFVISHARPIAWAFIAVVTLSVASAPFIEVNQLVNGEVSATTQLREDQAVLESDFAGFLGPEIAVKRSDGRKLTHPDDIRRLRALTKTISDLPFVDRADCYCDFLPLENTKAANEQQLLALQSDRRFAPRMRALMTPELDQASITVYISDIGSNRLRQVKEVIERASFWHLGYAYDTKVYGQWWLAQKGLNEILRDMLLSFATSLFIILPILALSLGSVRLFMVSLVPNLLPMVFALAFAAWAGIPIRIGTAMVLAIAIGIAVDDTIHIMVKLKRQAAAGAAPNQCIEEAIRHTGSAIVLTSVVLVAGFLSMLINDLLAIQDMGLLAAATLVVAFLSDVYLAPALFLMSTGQVPERTAPSLSGKRVVGTAFLQSAAT